MSYEKFKTVVGLNPEFFRLEALAYNANPTDRKQWLQKQLINLQSATNRYLLQLNTLMNEGAKLDGVSDAGKWMQTIGGISAAIPLVASQVAGIVVLIAGSIFSAAEKKKDSKALQQLSGQARTIQLEMTQIKAYQDSYSSELQTMKLMPVALFATAAYILMKK